MVGRPPDSSNKVCGPVDEGRRRKTSLADSFEATVATVNFIVPHDNVPSNGKRRLGLGLQKLFKPRFLGNDLVTLG
ncbi:Hypothetical predicted protein [Octopus vulgaris]|uniref:Uncharacterized protein n=1 Tax=Octopus vulgaris TaxID=6645 RepID=A0AA36EUR1_OCTVU|nr:Hypothetical predicted protein [Octopus vulgaris]